METPGQRPPAPTGAPVSSPVPAPAGGPHVHASRQASPTSGSPRGAGGSGASPRVREEAHSDPRQLGALGARFILDGNGGLLKRNAGMSPCPRAPQTASKRHSSLRNVTACLPDALTQPRCYWGHLASKLPQPQLWPVFHSYPTGLRPRRPVASSAEPLGRSWEH